MSILNLLKAPLSFIRKDIIPIASARTFCSEVTEVAGNVEVKPKRGRRKSISLATCINYLDSKAYQTTYGDKPVWHVYVRNYKGGIPPDTRKSCKRGKIITTGTPCPICRDKFLLPDYRNVGLLKQFISPHGGQILETRKTGVCQTQQKRLTVAIKKAQQYGLLTFPVPIRIYDYSLYNK